MPGSWCSGLTTGLAIATALYTTVLNSAQAVQLVAIDVKYNEKGSLTASLHSTVVSQAFTYFSVLIFHPLDIPLSVSIIIVVVTHLALYMWHSMYLITLV